MFLLSDQVIAESDIRPPSDAALCTGLPQTPFGPALTSVPGGVTARPPCQPSIVNPRGKRDPPLAPGRGNEKERAEGEVGCCKCVMM